MDRRLTVGFYQVNRKTASMLPFSQALDTTYSVALDQRTRVVKDAKLRLERLVNDPATGIKVGEIIRIQSDNLPGMASVGDAHQDLPLPEGFGLAHSMVFAYDPQTDMLAMQKVRNGINTVRTAGYLREVCSGPIYSFLPVLRRDAAERLSNLSLTKIRVKIATPEDLSAVDTNQETVRASLAGLKTMAGSAYVEVTLGVGRSGGSLIERTTHGIANWLMEQSAEDRGGIKTLQVEGEDEDDPEEAEHSINLLTERLECEAILNFEADLEVNFERRKSYLLAEFQSQRDYLSRYAVVDGMQG